MKKNLPALLAALMLVLSACSGASTWLWLAFSSSCTTLPLARAFWNAVQLSSV